MTIYTVLGNREHPDYGVASIPFPIPDEDYTRIIDMLNAIDVGSALNADCYVAEINSPLPMLKCLEDTEVNVDEMDFLAKRLDSFADYELLQFQAMATKNGYITLKDLINLTYSCQQVTVVSIFSDLEAIGRHHFLNLHGGAVSTELAQANNRLVALGLLQNNLDGKITPYGVVYENDFHLSEVYSGAGFPQYRYQNCMMELDVVQGNKTATLYLPASDVQIFRTLERSGIDRGAAYSMHITDSSFGVSLEDYLTLECETLMTLNAMCEAAAGVESEKLGAIIRSTAPESAEQIEFLAQEAENFDFYPGISTPDEYGRYFIQDSGHFEYDDNLEDYYDYARFGKDRITYEHGVFGETGYIVYRGTFGFDEIMEQSNMPTSKNTLVGRVTYINGDVQEYTDVKAFVKCIREELPYHATSGFRFETLTDAPTVRKAVDDAVYSFYGEENPYQLIDYGTASEFDMTMEGM